MSNFGPAGPQVFNTGARGQEPSVALVVDGDEVLFAERYQVRLSILTQPSAFSLTFGTPYVLKDLIDLCQPNTPFALKINGRQVMCGRLDGYSSSGTSGVLQVEGRDALAPLHDAFMRQEDTFTDDTYAQLVRKVLDLVGLKDAKLFFSNRANRAAIVGKDPQNYRVKGTNPKAPRNTESEQIGSGTGGAIKKHIQSQLGERAYEFLKRHLDRAGLFLWATADGNFVLSEPYTEQAPAFRIQRSFEARPEFSDVEDHQFENKTAGRFSEISVYTRGETKRAGRTTSVATIEDTEMKRWGFVRPFTIRDANADTEKKAEYMARRRMAESRRAGWKLTYREAGLTAGSPLGGRLVWAPDTIVEVEDRRLGLDADFWVESVTFSSDPKTCTLVELMRPRDLIFGEGPT